MSLAAVADPFDQPTPLPFTPGIEVAGTGVALGGGVEAPPVGSEVFGIAGPYANGGYAELAVAQQANVIPAPEGLDPDVAASLLAVGLTATLMLSEVGHVGEGSTVFVPAAAGGLGSYAVQIAKALGSAKSSPAPPPRTSARSRWTPAPTTPSTTAEARGPTTCSRSPMAAASTSRSR